MLGQAPVSVKLLLSLAPRPSRQAPSRQAPSRQAPSRQAPPPSGSELSSTELGYKTALQIDEANRTFSKRSCIAPLLLNDQK